MQETKISWAIALLCGVAIIAMALSDILMAQPASGRVHTACVGPRGPELGLAGPPWGKPPPPPMSAVLNVPELALDDVQQEQIFNLNHERMPALRTQMIAADKAMQSLQQLVRKQPFDQLAARTIVQTQAEAMAQVAFIQAQIEADTRAVLTPQQRQFLDKRPACHSRL